MKKFLSLLMPVLFACAVWVPMSAHAATPADTVDCTGATDSAFCEDRQPTGTNPLFGPSGVLTRAASFLAIVTGVISLFIMTIAGLRFITSGGDSQKVESARQAILYAVIGIAVAVASQAIVTFVLNRL